MKRLILSLVLMASVLSANAFGYERAREQALFLSDKMAYELNLTQEQYDMAYQINLDYFMSVSSYHDILGMYWQYRNADLRYILYDWQYSLFCSLDYFYQPIRWIRSSWYFPVYSRYSRTHFFFGRPGVYGSYRGGWRAHGSRSVSPYASHRPHNGRGLRDYHYPGARPSGNYHSGHNNGEHYGGGHRNDGYRSGNRNGNGYGRGQGNNNNNGRQGYGQGQDRGRGRGSFGNQGQNNNRGQSSFGNQGQSSGRGQGSFGNQGQSSGRGQGSFGNQGQSSGRGQGSFGNQGQNNSRGQGRAHSPSQGSSRPSGNNGSGRAGGRSYGR